MFSWELFCLLVLFCLLAQHHVNLDFEAFSINLFIFSICINVSENEQCLQIMNLGLRGEFMYYKHKISEILP